MMIPALHRGEIARKGGSKGRASNHQNNNEEDKGMNINLVLSDIYWVFWREIKRFIQQKARNIMASVQPVVWLVLMGNNMVGTHPQPMAAKCSGTGNYLEFMTPAS